MDLIKLENSFNRLPEVEVVRLMTGNFEVAAFTVIKPLLPDDIAGALTSAMKFRNHLGIEKVSLTRFISKMKGLEDNSKKDYVGKVSKPCGYSGTLLQDSKTLIGTVDELVSPNEYNYFLKLYPWYTKPSNEIFSQYVDQLGEEQIFLHLPSFDVNSLLEKEDVVKITDKGIHLTNKSIIPIKEVS